MKHLTGSWIVWYAVTLHLLWAVLCAVSADALGTVPLASVGGLGQAGASSVFAAAGGLALFALLTERSIGTYGLVFLLPQQMLMVMSAFTALTLIAAGHYADGVIRPRAFIASDQAPFVIGAVFHTCALFERYGPSWTATTGFRSRL